ncbi:MAG: cold shock domain-containing protein [Acidobacteria bacterium]|nr:cold shock domain-containing protein [Acidobacteriota bacterium]
MPYGEITRLVLEHGFGFLRDDAGLDWFFVGAGVRGRAADLQIGQPVEFSAEWTASGPRAIDIHPAAER